MRGHLESLLRLWRDADELTTLRDHVCHLTHALDVKRALVASLRARLAAEELVAHCQAVHVDTLRRELDDCHAHIAYLMHPSSGGEQ